MYLYWIKFNAVTDSHKRSIATPAKQPYESTIRISVKMPKLSQTASSTLNHSWLRNCSKKMQNIKPPKQSNTRSGNQVNLSHPKTKNYPQKPYHQLHELNPKSDRSPFSHNFLQKWLLPNIHQIIPEKWGGKKNLQQKDSLLLLRQKGSDRNVLPSS